MASTIGVCTQASCQLISTVMEGSQLKRQDNKQCPDGVVLAHKLAATKGYNSKCADPTQTLAGQMSTGSVASTLVRLLRQLPAQLQAHGTQSN